MLVRVLESHPSATALGIDSDETWVEAARTTAAHRGVASKSEFRCASADEVQPSSSRFDVAINIAASHAHGGYAGALHALSRFVPSGGTVLFGEGFWRKPPSPEFLEALGGASPDELTGLDDLFAQARTVGLVLERWWVASPESWEQYEMGLARNADALPGPDASRYAEAIRRRRALPDGCDTLGFALLELRRTPERSAAR